MNIKALKESLYDQIDQLQNETALETLHEAVVEYNKHQEHDILDDLSPQQLENLNASIKQVEEGNVSAHEEVMAKAKEWLKK